MMVIVPQFSAHSPGGHRRHWHERHRRSPAHAGLFRFRLGHQAIHYYRTAAKSWRDRLSKATKPRMSKVRTSWSRLPPLKPTIPKSSKRTNRKIPVIPRAEMLAELMRLKYGIAVAGAHGKTTTTSMVASILAAAHLDPTFVIGGKVNQAGTTARLGRGEYFVVEADESDRSFLMFAPVVAVVTTIDREHLDQYSSLEDIQGAFLQFVNRVPFYGAAILCLDEPNVQAIIPDVKRPIITYGTSSQADLVISDIEARRPRQRLPAHL